MKGMGEGTGHPVLFYLFLSLCLLDGKTDQVPSNKEVTVISLCSLKFTSKNKSPFVEYLAYIPETIDYSR